MRHGFGGWGHLGDLRDGVELLTLAGLDLPALNHLVPLNLLDDALLDGQLAGLQRKSGRHAFARRFSQKMSIANRNSMIFAHTNFESPFFPLVLEELLCHSH